jgi:hypothetical protein
MHLPLTRQEHENERLVHRRADGALSAMEAGIADRFWTADELVGLLDTPAPVAA